MGLASYDNWFTVKALTYAEMGIAVATVTHGGRNRMQAARRAVMHGAIGSTAPELVPTLGRTAT